MEFQFKKLAEIREDRNISVPDVATLVGVTEATYAKYENGTSTPKLENVIKIADALDVSLDFLFGRTDNPDIIYDKDIEEDDEQIEPVECELDEFDWCINPEDHKDLIDECVMENLKPKFNEYGNISIREMVKTYNEMRDDLFDQAQRYNGQSIKLLAFICKLLPKNIGVVHTCPYDNNDFVDHERLDDMIAVSIRIGEHTSDFLISNEYAEYFDMYEEDNEIFIPDDFYCCDIGDELMSYLDLFKSIYKVKKRFFA